MLYRIRKQFSSDLNEWSILLSSELNRLFSYLCFAINESRSLDWDNWRHCFEHIKVPYLSVLIKYKEELEFERIKIFFFFSQE